MIIFGLIILTIVLVSFILNELYLWRVMGNSQEILVVKGKNRKKKYDAIAFGSAYCRYSIDFGEFNGFNFGIGSQFFYYTDKMLREIAPMCLKKGGTVFLIIADLVFAKEGKGMYGPERYQLMLTRKTLGDEYDLKTFLKVRFPLIYNPRLIKRVGGYYYHKIKGDYSKKQSKPFTEIMVKQAAVERCNSWCREFNLIDTKTDELPQTVKDQFVKTRIILSRMIDFCIDNGYRPILVVTPVSEIMNNELSNAFIKSVLYDNIQVSNKQNALFLDYLRDSRFADYKQYYQSADLLNLQERRHFTEVLLRDSSLI